MTDIEKREQSFTPAVRQLSDEARAALAAGRADSTRKAYREDREAFIAWCKKQGAQPLPATQDLLIEYVTHLTLTPRPRTGRPSAPSSLERMLSAITTMHAELDLPKPETKGARTVIAGYKHQLAIDKKPGGKQQQAKAALPPALRKMLATLDRDTLIGKRDAAMLLLGYAAATRSSELVGIDINEPVEDDKGYLVSIYRVKMKKFTESAIAYGKSPATCPVRALRALITAMHEEGRTDGPLFVRIDRHGRIAPPMTRKGKPIGDPAWPLAAPRFRHRCTARRGAHDPRSPARRLGRQLNIPRPLLRRGRPLGGQPRHGALVVPSHEVGGFALSQTRVSPGGARRG
ncbi:integrase [Streptomyces exfoliatus]|uniref:integrase n=1 Tax=Streptomyces exfoliatus TaxID=1905 RepID=UPI000689F303|nr:integrase [Streptomyces exfoliatus]